MKVKGSIFVVGLGCLFIGAVLGIKSEFFPWVFLPGTVLFFVGGYHR